MPAPGAAFMVISYFPNIIYHLEFICGASPDCATVKDAPFASYVGVPWVVNSLDAPEVKSMVTDLPSAGSGWHC